MALFYVLEKISILNYPAKFFWVNLMPFVNVNGASYLPCGSRLKNEVNLFPCVCPRCLFSLLAFEIRCIGRALLVLGSRLKNEVNMHVSSVSPPCLFSLMDFEIWCIGRVLLVLGSRLKNEVYIPIHTCFPAFIFGVYFHCKLYMFVGTKMQPVTFTIRRCNIVGWKLYSAGRG